MQGNCIDAVIAHTLLQKKQAQFPVLAMTIIAVYLNREQRFFRD